MSPGQCSCPECGTILRVRDRSFIGREIECPDCQAKLIIKLTDDRELIAERPTVEKPKKKKPLQSSVSAATPPTPGIAAKLLDVVRSPLALAWGLGIGITAFVAIMLLRPAVRLRPAVKDPSQSVVVAPEPKPSPTTIDESPADLPATTPMPTDPPAEPTENPIVADTKAAAVVDPPTQTPTPPATPEVKPEPAPKPMPVVVKLDIEAMLAQKLKSFETPAQPKSRREILELVEELLGAPIRYDADELGQKNLDRSISIDLENTTVGGVLKVLLDSAGWEYIVEDSGIRLRPRQVAGAEK